MQDLVAYLIGYFVMLSILAFNGYLLLALIAWAFWGKGDINLFRCQARPGPDEKKGS